MIAGIKIIGDSHVTFFERAGIMRSHWLGPLNCVTIYKLLEQGLDLFSLQQFLQNSAHYKNVGVYPWQCPSGVYDVPNVKPGDIAIFSFGFNDVQKNINKYAASNPKDEILKLIHGYIERLKQYESKYKITCVPLSIPPNPAPRENESYGHYLYGIGGEFDAHGTTEERRFYTEYANDRLRKACRQNGLKFLYIYDVICCADGFLKKEYTEDFVHLRHDMPELVNKIEERLKELFITFDQTN